MKKYTIKKVMSGDTERLPLEVDTPIFADYEKEPSNTKLRLIYSLYRAIEKRENYYQDNTPTAFGDAEYRYYVGYVAGIKEAENIVEYEENGYLLFKKNRRVILAVEKIKKPSGYYQTKKEIIDFFEKL